ncbi:MBL fold metallo-hydrolase [Chloroflexi bacterium TSY]|nr:MBL fold metallo-hydrolase [Chloroflexi bacterium TSY]
MNHASFIIDTGHVRLMSDPWLFGSAFNNGWDLLCETKFAIDDFCSITHIWFSHEHPDHFAPSVLKQIPEEIRRQIIVLFQETNDRKVIGYCSSLGFQIQELRNHEWFNLSPDLRIMCGKVPFFDSWLLVETHNTKILNINDCVVDGEGIATEIVRHTGRVDLLFTQFSYANWEGNPDEVERRRASAQEKLARVKIQVETFQPKYTIPFASFIYFSHEENAFCNDAINTIQDAYEFIQAQCESQSIILYPGDRWIVGVEHDNHAALATYAKASERTPKPLRQTESISLTELADLGNHYIERVQKKNSRLFIWLLSLPPLRYFETLTFQLVDHDQVVAFDLRNSLRVVKKGADQADIVLSSESLAFVFRHDWGFDTLTVNGRFQASQHNYKRMIKAFFLGSLNNTGRALHPKTLFEPSFIKRALGKLRNVG